MRVPLAWLREYVELPSDPHAVASALANLGFPVDGIEERPQITGVVIGKIAALHKHPNADRLLVGMIDVGAAQPLTIATAATNVAAGQTIAVATIGARLPKLVIERRKMRGLESEGMMISADELALPPEWFEDGIMQFDADLSPGTNVVEHFGLADAVLDVDVTSNRPDALSMLGLARELAAALRVALRAPDLANPGSLDDGAQAPRVTLDSPDCHRFVAQRFTGLHVATGPAFIRIRLALAGQRPIDNIVDLSNYVMLETGQPLHVYDAQAIPGEHFVVRDAHQGETFVALDGAKYDLTPEDLVIADEQRVLALAGIKGGRASEVSAGTTAILLESANFEGARIRRASAKLALRTEASTRHEKSLAAALTDWGAARAAQLLVRYAGATAYAPHAFGEALETRPPIRFEVRQIERLLGFALSQEEAREYLDALGFAAQPLDDRTLAVTPPPWRRDVTLSADVVEEIARIAGYDRVEAAIPAVAGHDIGSGAYRLERGAAKTMVALGYREIISYALHGTRVFDRFARAGVEVGATPLEVRNPLSEEQRYLRESLLPAMLEHLARAGEPERIFEIGHVFSREDDHPHEVSSLAFAFSAPPIDEPDWRDTHFLRLKGDAEHFVRQVTGRHDFEIAREVRTGLHPGKSAALLIDGVEVANLGAVDPRLAGAFDVSLPAYFCALNLEVLPDYRVARYAPPPKYPSTYRDLALLCALDVNAGDVEATVCRSIGALCTDARAFDEYRGTGIDTEKKSLAVRVTLQRPDGTITDAQADDAIAVALVALHEELGAVLRQ